MRCFPSSTHGYVANVDGRNRRFFAQQYPMAIQKSPYRGLTSEKQGKGCQQQAYDELKLHFQTLRSVWQPRVPLGACELPPPLRFRKPRIA